MRDELPGLESEFKIGRRGGAPAFERLHLRRLVKRLLHFHDGEAFHILRLRQPKPAAPHLDHTPLVSLHLI
jgi:hypothetical protein